MRKTPCYTSRPTCLMTSPILNSSTVSIKASRHSNKLMSIPPTSIPQSSAKCHHPKIIRRLICCHQITITHLVSLHRPHRRMGSTILHSTQDISHWIHQAHTPYLASFRIPPSNSSNITGLHQINRMYLPTLDIRRTLGSQRSLILLRTRYPLT